MAAFTRTAIYTIPCEYPSAWKISFATNGNTLILGLFFGDKETPTHHAEVSVTEFQEMLSDLGIGP